MAFIQSIIDDDHHTHQFTSVNKLILDQLASERIYHLSEIYKVCVVYRLRFLDQSFYKLQLPAEALEQIEQLNKNHKTNLHSFKIIAPAQSLKLENYDDPLLFAPMGNDYYYLVHKWGNDLHPLRKWLVWPMKSLGNIVISILLFSMLTLLILPIRSYNTTSYSTVGLITFLFVFKSYCAIFIYYFFWKGKQFSTSNWDSKHYN